MLWMLRHMDVVTCDLLSRGPYPVLLLSTRYKASYNCISLRGHVSNKVQRRESYDQSVHVTPRLSPHGETQVPLQAGVFPVNLIKRCNGVMWQHTLGLGEYRNFYFLLLYCKVSTTGSTCTMNDNDYRVHWMIDTLLWNSLHVTLSPLY